MEKSMSTDISPRQSGSSAFLLVAVGGFSLYWATFFSMFMRNSFLDVAIENLWYHLVLRIAFFIGFGICSFAISHIPKGFVASHQKRAMNAFVFLFSLIAALSAGTYFVLQTPHPLFFDMIAWSLSGVGLCCLFFLWIGAIQSITEQSIVKCLALSVACGSGFYLVINLLPSPFNIVMLAICPLLSLAILRALPSESNQSLDEVVTLRESRHNAHLSWAFGAVYIVYGIVFGLGAGSVTQIAGDATLLVGLAALSAIGALASYYFMQRFKGRIRQSNMLRMLFPFLVISLVPMSFFTDITYIICNVVLVGTYVFLLIVSIAFELQTARARHASSLFFIGMSQTALNAGLVVGYGLGFMASATGVINFSILSAIALGLVVLLAMFITFAPIDQNDNATNGQQEGFVASLSNSTTQARPSNLDEGAQPTDHEPGHWKACCTSLAQRYGLSPRETEVFLYLAKGRGIEHIQNKLFISGHTVKTHTYNIYRKMDIGSREQLLDIIEKEKSATRKDTI